jgi:pimeloyl-ACP methyl ester carboxylesterase
VTADGTNDGGRTPAAEGPAARLPEAVRRPALPKAAAIALGSAAALAGVAAVVNWQARAAERRHPPIGDFVTVNGVRLHYLDVGEGPAVVLLHGNSSMVQDFALSILEPLARNHRVIAFDRPGFGYSDRPKEVLWTPEAQAALIRDALDVLGVEKPVILGHSWAAAVALCFALDYPNEISGVVVESGYYYPYRRPDAAISAINSKPIIGWIGRNTWSPVMGLIFGKAMVKGMFSPNPIPPAYAEFPAKLALRPGHLRAGAEEAATMRDWALRTWQHFPEIEVPVMIVAGTKDRLASYQKHAVRLHHDILGSRLRLWPGTGHMLHHIHPDGVIDAIEEVWEMAGAGETVGEKETVGDGEPAYVP